MTLRQGAVLQVQAVTEAVLRQQLPAVHTAAAARARAEAVAIAEAEAGAEATAEAVPVVEVAAEAVPAEEEDKHNPKLNAII